MPTLPRPIARLLARVLCLLALSPALAALAQPPAAAPSGATPPAASIASTAPSAATAADYVLGPGDRVRVSVFQSPELSTETRLAENGNATLPLLGEVPLAGATVTEAEHRVAQGLLRARLVRAPQVTIEVTEIRAHQAAVLGFVVHPGRYPLESSATHLSELMAQAGGTTPDAADLITVSGTRNGKPMRMTVDFRQLTTGADREHDIVIRNNDIVYAPRAPQVYVYGEVQRPGTVRLEPGMRVLQALAAAGGLTLRGTQRGIRVSRPGPDGQLVQTTPGLQAVLQPEDVVYVPESLF